MILLNFVSPKVLSLPLISFKIGITLLANRTNSVIVFENCYFSTASYLCSLILRDSLNLSLILLQGNLVKRESTFSRSPLGRAKIKNSSELTMYSFYPHFLKKRSR